VTALQSLDGTRTVWQPLPRQAVALSCPAFEVLYGGQKGGGKTDFLVACVVPLLQRAHEKYLRTGQKQHRCRIVIFRKNIDDLTDIKARTKELYPVLDPEMGESGFNSNLGKWTFTSGATVELRHLDGPEDHKGYNGQELRAVLFDQVEEIPYDVYAFLLAQIRTTDPDYRDLLMTRSTANPGGRHGDWVYERFIKPHPAGNKILVETITNKNKSVREVTRAFVPAALSDNPYLDADGQYEANMRATLPEHMLKQYLEGDWNVVVGAFFASRIIPHLHSMTWAEFLNKSKGGIPASWDVGFGLDWGSSAPAATIFCAKDANDRIWCFDELYCPGDTGKAYGEKLRAKFANQNWSREHRWQQHDMYGMVDSEAWARFGADGAAPADTMSSMGFRLFPANKDRMAGNEQIFERLRVRPDGLPGLIIIRDQCPNLWRTFRTVRTDDKSPDRRDYDKRDEAHAVDAMRFFLMDRPVSLFAPADPDLADIQKWERMFADARKRQAQAEIDEWEQKAS